MKLSKIITLVALTLAFGGFISPQELRAADMSMDRLKASFESETRTRWEYASEEEKREFVRKVMGLTEPTQTDHTQGSQDDQNDQDDQTEQNAQNSAVDNQFPLWIKRKFENETGTSWDKTNKSERENFFKKLKEKDERKKKLAEKQLNIKKRRLESLRSEKEARKKQLIRKREQREADKEKKRKRKEAKIKKMKEMMSKFKLKTQKQRQKDN